MTPATCRFNGQAVRIWASPSATLVAEGRRPDADRERAAHKAHSVQLRRVRIPPYHWWRTVFYLIPAISVYTIVLGTLSILSTFVDRKGHAAHWCARAWSWLILATTGVEVDVQGLERVRRGETYVFIS